MRNLILAQIDQQVVGEIANTAFQQARDIINIVLPIVLGVVLLVGTVYAIVLGVNYSKAEDADQRKNARERLVGAVVGFLVALVLIAIIYALLLIFLPKTKINPLTDEQFSEAITVIEKSEEGSTTKKYYLNIGGVEFGQLTECTNPKDKGNDFTEAAKNETLTFRNGNLKITGPTSLVAKWSGGNVTVTITYSYNNETFTNTATIPISSASGNATQTNIEELFCCAA